MSLSHADIGFIEAIGPDARSWLQNLATNDVRPLAPGDGCETFFTTHKARTIAHAVVHCLRDDAFLLAVESGRADKLLEHLDRHLISERVELATRDWSLIRILGTRAEPWSERTANGPVSELKPWQLRSLGNDGFVRRQAALHLPGFDFFGPKEWIASIDHGEPHESFEEIENFRIESAWPRWGREMDENRFVVELGRTATAISYAKGCYLGQEPIVMARDRGQVNRQLFGFKSDVDVPLGTSIMKGEVEQFRVTSCACSPDWVSFVGLAFVYRGAGSDGDTIALPDGGGVTLSSLPMIPG